MDTSCSNDIAVCDKHGAYRKILVCGVAMRCPKCTEEYEQEEEKKAKIKKADEIIRMAGIPRRFIDRTFATFCTEEHNKRRALRAVVEYAESIPNEGACLIMCGSVGTGKTHLSCALIQYLAKKGVSAAYTTTYSMIRRIRDTWKNNAIETEKSAIHAFTSPSVLVIDEVGVQYGTDSEKLIMFDILNSRYENRKSTVFASNFTPDKLRDFFGERISDRLREDGVIVLNMRWESHRRRT